MPLYPVVDYLQDYTQLLEEKRLVAQQQKLEIEPVFESTNENEPKTVEEKIMVVFVFYLFAVVLQLTLS